MISTRSLRRTLSILFATLFLSLSSTPVAFAGIVSSEQIINAQQVEKTRAHLSALLTRKDVQTALTARGVDVADAQKRVANMTDAEVQTLASRIDELPAGGRLSNLELILLILLIVILV